MYDRSRGRTLGATAAVFAGVALVLGCQTHRPAATSPAAAERTVLLHQTWSLASVSLLVEIRETASGQVRGRMQVMSGDVNRTAQERSYGCRATRTGDYGSDWTCEVPFARGAPDWRALLARLDALGVNAPPAVPPQVPGRLQLICGDGTHWAVEVRPAGGGPPVRHASVCGPTDSLGLAFAAGVDSVLGTLQRAGTVR